MPALTAPYLSGDIAVGHDPKVPHGAVPALKDTQARASGLRVLGRPGPVAPDEQIADSVAV